MHQPAPAFYQPPSPLNDRAPTLRETSTRTGTDMIGMSVREVMGRVTVAP
jgi:hypothetical protein